MSKNSKGSKIVYVECVECGKKVELELIHDEDLCEECFEDVFCCDSCDEILDSPGEYCKSCEEQIRVARIGDSSAHELWERVFGEA